MIDKFQREKIQTRAFEIFEWRRENDIAGCALGDWLEAETEFVIDKRTNDGCPKCGYSLIARRDDKIICLKCDWNIEAKRKTDKETADFNEIRKDW